MREGLRSGRPPAMTDWARYRHVRTEYRRIAIHHMSVYGQPWAQWALDIADCMFTRLEARGVHLPPERVAPAVFMLVLKLTIDPLDVPNTHELFPGAMEDEWMVLDLLGPALHFLTPRLIFGFEPQCRSLLSPK